MGWTCSYPWNFPGPGNFQVLENSMGSCMFSPWKFPGPGNFHGVGHGNFHGPKCWHFVPWQDSSLQSQKFQVRVYWGSQHLYFTISFGLDWTEHWKLDNRINLVKKYAVGHGNFHGPKRKKILLTERKTYFNPVQAILSDKLYPIIITIFKKKY